MSPGLILAFLLLQTAQRAPSPAPAVAQQVRTSEELIARVRDRYAHCRTYREQAVGRRHYGDSDLGTRENVYLLAFERPDRFRFEQGERTRWQLRGEEVVWHDRDVWRAWSRREAAPRDATAQTAQWSFGMFDVFAEWILPLLDAPDLHGDFERKFWDEAHPVGEVVREAVGGVDRWRISLEYRKERTRLWIDDDGGIRRIEPEDVAPSATRDELDLSPEFDVALDPADLALSPPRTTGVKPSVVMHVFEVLGIVTMGTIGILLGMRLQQTGRPFTVSSHLFWWFAVTVGGAEFLGRFVDQFDTIFSSRVSGAVMLLVVGAGAWPVLLHLRRTFGFHVVGVDHATFLTALRAVAAGVGVPAKISAATAKVTIDGREFDVAQRPKWSMFGLLSREKGARELLERLRNLIGVCFESDELPTDRRAGARCIAWSVAMIGGAVAVGVIYFGFLDRL
jgi:hypothetical protein